MIKMWQKPQQTLFLLAAEKQLIPVVDPFRVQEEMIETKNFVPESLMIYHFQDIKRSEMICAGFSEVSEGDKRMLDMHVKFGASSNPFDEDEPFLFLVKKAKDEDEADDDDDDDEDWDEDDDDDDEEWDEDVEEDDWEDDDEEWDEDEDEDWDDEDEDKDEDWGEEKN